MTILSFTLHESVKDPTAELWFAEPSGFVALPLDAMLPALDSQAANTLRTALAPFLDAARDEAIRQQFIAQFANGQQLLSALCEVGTVHCSIGLHRDDIDDTGDNSGQPLLSLFTLSWRDTAVAPRAVTAARAVTSSEGHRRVEYAEFPCGPVTLGETVLTPSAESGLPQAPLLQIHAYVPHPDCKRLVVLTLSTTAVVRREEYRAVLQQIAETVSFESPLESGTSEAS
ncbi:MULTISPECIES: hypothetical protein [unclassified Streptomyces]|uniref:hypothetical protein n=1 Tax=unclassified Streptomyces TaxID=2593676 RepID=UPI002DD9B641|nr:hypothetical protein [Streptomyces sp. NBC_00243]WRZ22140.1 hypothetical protein OHT59_28485 [Streptomyces sp. NBC_00243]